MTSVGYGLDAILRFFGDEYLTLKWVQTFDRARVEPSDLHFAQTGLAQIQFQRRRNVGLNYWGTATWSGADYQPDVGFATRQNVTELGWRMSYDWRRGERSIFRQISPLQFFGFVALRNPDRSVESSLFEYNLDLEWKSGAEVSADLQLHHEDLREALSLPGSTRVPPGSYTYVRTEGGYETPPGRPVRLELDWGLGGFFDGWIFDPSLEATWNVLRFFELGGQYEFSRARFSEREQEFDAHLFRLRVRTSFDTRLSIQSFLQYNSTAHVIAANVRFRYNVREGNDLWVVYNEGLNTDRHRAAPVLPLTNTRTVLIKYTYTFIL